MVAIAGLLSGLGSLAGGLSGLFGGSGQSAQYNQMLQQMQNQQLGNISNNAFGNAQTMGNNALNMGSSMVNPQISAILGAGMGAFSNANDLYTQGLANQFSQSNALMQGAMGLQNTKEQNLGEVYKSVAGQLGAGLGAGMNSLGGVYGELAKGSSNLADRYLQGLNDNSGVKEQGALGSQQIAGAAGQNQAAITGSANIAGNQVNQAGGIAQAGVQGSANIAGNQVNQAGALAQAGMQGSAEMNKQGIASQADYLKALQQQALANAGTIGQAGLQAGAQLGSQNLSSLASQNAALAGAQGQLGSALAQGNAGNVQEYLKNIGALQNQGLAGLQDYMGKMGTTGLAALGNLQNTQATGLANIYNTTAGNYGKTLDAAASAQAQLLNDQSASNAFNRKMSERKFNRTNARGLAMMA